jgi:hypothetical protein
MGLQTEGEKLSAGQKALFSPGGSAPEAFSSSEMNLYRYCGDDPVDRNDPLGLEFYDHDPEPVLAIQGKFGNTESRVSVGVNAIRAADGTFTLYVSHYDVFVTEKQIAQTANGRSRTPAVIAATIEHENHHSDKLHRIHDHYQHKVLQTGLKSEPSYETKLQQSNRLSEAFDRAAKQDQTDCKKPTLEWKPFVNREK